MKTLRALCLLSLFVFSAPIVAQNKTIAGEILSLTQKKTNPKPTKPIRTQTNSNSSNSRARAEQRIRELSRQQNRKNTKQEIKKSTDKDFVFQVKAQLGDGRILEGRLPLKAPETFLVKHNKDGIVYEKKIALDEIEGLEILSWSGHSVAQKKTGVLYRFVPSRFHIHLKNKQTLKTNGDTFQFLNQFPLFNDQGKVYLFSFWLDLQKKDGSWHTGLSGPVQMRRICHKDVVQKITFTQSKKDSQQKLVKE